MGGCEEYGPFLLEAYKVELALTHEINRRLEDNTKHL